jgi:hypothetical protein
MAAQTFGEFAADLIAKGEVANVLFEARLFELLGVLHRIAPALDREGVEHELVGGLAVLVHVESSDPDHAMLTRDVDLLVRRRDLDRIIDVAARQGFRHRHSAGLDTLCHGAVDRARNSVHLLFEGGPNPVIAPEVMDVYGELVRVAPVRDLVAMKLGAWRMKDRVHVQTLDSVGLITPEVEESLPAELAARLAEVRASE